MLETRAHAPWDMAFCFCFFFNDTATTEIYTLSLHDALPICGARVARDRAWPADAARADGDGARSEEHTSELQSHLNLVCRLLLEKNKQHTRCLITTESPCQLTRIVQVSSVC